MASGLCVGRSPVCVSLSSVSGMCLESQVPPGAGKEAAPAARELWAVGNWLVVFGFLLLPLSLSPLGADKLLATKACERNCTLQNQTGLMWRASLCLGGPLGSTPFSGKSAGAFLSETPLVCVFLVSVLHSWVQDGLFFDLLFFLPGLHL